MKIGDLVKPMVSCGGKVGEIRCEHALITVRYPRDELLGAEESEYDLICACGEFEAPGSDLELINESR